MVETFHILGCKRRVECNELVKDTAQGPNITLVIVGFVLPHLGTGVVRSSCLCLKNSCFSNFAHIQIT